MLEMGYQYYSPDFYFAMQWKHLFEDGLATYFSLQPGKRGKPEKSHAQAVGKFHKSLGVVVCHC